MRKIVLIFTLLGTLFLESCAQGDDSLMPAEANEVITFEFKYLALGDSYTYGQSVCSSCNFPQQLTDSLNLQPGWKGQLISIAQTGWTTSDLISGVASADPANDFDLVTLLIGVNNQYQGKPFSLYEEEFPELLQKAIQFAQGDPSKVIVLSIPDYAYTPFGENTANSEEISEEIAQYNTKAQQVSQDRGVRFLHITDITQEGLLNPALVASDGLHPSALAYKKFVERLYPLALNKID